MEAKPTKHMLASLAHHLSAASVSLDRHVAHGAPLNVAVGSLDHEDGIGGAGRPDPVGGRQTLPDQLCAIPGRNRQVK